MAIIADEIKVGSDSQLDNVLLVSRASGSPDDFNPGTYPDAKIDIQSDVTMDNIILASRGDVIIQDDATLGGALCDANRTSVQIFAMQDVIFQSDIAISNAEIAAGHDVSVESDAVINLSGSGTTIQAINDVMVQSDGTFGACPNDDNVPGPVEEVVLRLVD